MNQQIMLTMMKRPFLALFFTVCITVISREAAAQKKTIAQRVDSVLKLMTLDEKIGQLNQYSSKDEVTGPESDKSNLVQEIKAGKVGSMLNVRGVERTR